MYCSKCNHDLAECTCPDLEERLEAILKHPSIFLIPPYVESIRKRIEKNKLSLPLDETRGE